jgi:alanyl-tRNA synthetase
MFGEKYGERVRTLQVGDFSKELCGGTHVGNSGNIGPFRITTETAVSAGTRRMEAVTGFAALQLARQERSALANLATALKVPTGKVQERVQELSDELKRAKKDLDKALAPDLGVELARLKAAVQSHRGANSVVLERPGLQANHAQNLLKMAQQACDPLAAVLLSAVDGEVLVVAAVSQGLTGKVKAGDLVKAVTAVIGGGGGGRPEMAQGKGKDGSRLQDAVGAAEAWLRSAGVRA